MSNQLIMLYTSSLCSKNMEQKLLSVTPESVGLQIQKYHRLLAKGFCNNGVKVEVLSYQKGIEQIRIEDQKKECENGINYIYLTNCDGGYAKLLWDSFAFANKFFKNNKNAVMICDVLNFTVSFGAALAARLHRKKIIGIITDFPEQLSGGQNVHSRLIWRLVELCTGYVVLTEQMKERINPQKPAIVLEGHVDSDMEQIENKLSEKYEKKVCIYAGMLHKKYGIEKLVKAFIMANVTEAELHIYGDGDYADELKSLNNKSVKYYGIVPNSVVVNEEIKATLLINPRPTNEEFTKYSFPSKNLEYMVSGTPLLTTKLPGMPEEYLDYVYIFDDETLEGMKNTLEKILSKSKEELHRKGTCSRKYVLMCKNNNSQASKILNGLNISSQNGD